MRHQNVLSLFVGLLALAVAGGPARAQFFGPADWPLNRAASQRQAQNTGGAFTDQMDRVWTFPQAREMPAEIVVDNGTDGAAVPPFSYTVAASGQAFATAGAWTYPAAVDRAGGAWPFSDGDTNKVGDYVFANAVQSAVLAQVGTDRLAELPNLGTDTQDVADYKKINDELTTNGTVYARWTFGTAYPVGTRQGARRVAFGTPYDLPAVTPWNQPLQANQRYAVYVLFPVGVTTVGGVTHPLVNRVMARVSWGADPNSPITSRIFMLDTTEGGGQWLRIRTGTGDDRYFPYDGTNPIRVTLYALTPDDPNDTSLYGATPLVAADAVRLVPEALRGDVRAAAASGAFPARGGAVTDPRPWPRQLTFFGREETAGPRILFPILAEMQAAANLSPSKQPYLGSFPPTLYDPSKAHEPDPDSADFNPYIPDPTNSLRSSAFYGFEDDIANRLFGRLVWRQPANYLPMRRAPETANPNAQAVTVTLPPTTIDDTAAAPVFTQAGFTAVAGTATNHAYNTGYLTAPSTAGGGATATWNTRLPVLDTTYTVMVWIPAGVDRAAGFPFARYAHYTLQTAPVAAGGANVPMHVWFDQLNVTTQLDTLNRRPNLTGMWRVLATGVRFPKDATDPANVTLRAQVALTNDPPPGDPGGDALNLNPVVADAIQFIPESHSPSGVVTPPALLEARRSNAAAPPTQRLVYFGTDEGGQGHVWALDPLGVGPLSTLTTVAWVYPSITKPATVTGLTRPSDDPNISPHGNVGSRFDGDEFQTNAGGNLSYSTINALPAFGPVASSPAYFEVQRDAANRNVFEPFLVTGNDNGRLYAFEPEGRRDAVAAGGAGVDDPGVPGTSFRKLTWPSTARDLWMRAGAPNGKFDTFSDDADKEFFTASPTLRQTDGFGLSTLIVAGAGDGHVYALDPNEIDENTRLYDFTSTTNQGKPFWQYPGTTTALDPIRYTGTLAPSTGAGGEEKFIFAAGGRVYAITPGSRTAGVPDLHWVYPHTGTPPGNPAAGDLPALDVSFTAPAWLPTVNASLNGGNEVVFIADQDGFIYALKADTPGNDAGRVIWQRSFGGTRASVTFASGILNNFGAPTPAIPRPTVLLPIDAGGIVGVNADNPATDGGRLRWALLDSVVGFVPVNDTSGAPTFGNTSMGARPGDAIVSNRFVYNGDEGQPATGESHGIFRAYADVALTQFGGSIIPDEPDIRPGLSGTFDLRLVDLWNGTNDTPTGPWNTLGENPGSSPLAARGQARPDLVTGSNVTAYEWGDTITGAAWGAYRADSNPPIVVVRFTGAGVTRQITVAARRDLSPDAPAPLQMYDPATNGPVDALPWIAKISIPLGLPSGSDPQTPGSRRQMLVRAQRPNGQVSLVELNAGQTADTFGNPDAQPLNMNPAAPPTDPNSRIRYIAIAHPMALSTRGVAPAGTTNIIGWVPNVATSYAELLSNGNGLVQIAGGAISRTTNRDLVAPVGPVVHGASALYMGVDGAGNRLPALVVSDRSNLYAKQRIALSNVRVERRELAWGWNPNGADLSAFQKATGNAMNPLPWEQFPNLVPNVSVDYPDVDRTRVSVQGNGVDMDRSGIALPPPTVNGATRTLNPLVLDMQVSVPKFQPANVNRNYFDINGTLVPGDATNRGLLAPMVLGTGQPVAGGPLASPSAGYVGGVRVFVGVGREDRFSDRFAYRQMNVGISVPPDSSLSVEEKTLDVGNVPHSLGYAPNLPFAPSLSGPYSGAAPYLSPWDTPGGAQFFQPFTVQNRGNVNLVNLRAAKIIGAVDAAGNSTNPADPTYWVRLSSDETQNLLPTYNALTGALIPNLTNWLMNTPVIGVPFSTTGVGNVGIVSSLDHSNSAANFEIDYTTFGRPNFWPQPNAYVTADSPHVQNNYRGWAANTQPRPTAHKARPGDTAPTVFSIPDTYYGDPAGYLASLRAARQAAGVPDEINDFRPRIGVSVPLGTPAGTYSAPVYVFEDFMPEQWRSWLTFYDGTLNTGGTPGPQSVSRDDNGILDVRLAGSQTTPVEARSDPTFRLKATVREARLTNNITPGSYNQVDVTPQGANIVPAAFRLPTGNLLLYWASNRDNSEATGPPTRPDTPWFLLYTQLNAANGNVVPYGPLYDWRYEAGGTRWWNPLPAAAQYPDIAVAKSLFPSVTADVVGDPNTPLIPGVLAQNSDGQTLVQHSTPALAQDPTNGQMWLTWQGAAYKNAGGGAGSQSFSLDSRTFYVPLTAGGVPDTGVNSGVPYSFLNDPAVPKFAPKMVITGGGGSLMFWYGGPRGRTRLYYKSTVNLNNPASWRPDAFLPTPGTLQWQADPTPVRRIVTNDAGQAVEAIDLVYTGVLAHRRVPETMLTRYGIGGGGNLFVMPLPTVQRELMVREGSTATWSSRDVAWVFTDPVTRQVVDGAGNPVFQIYIYDQAGNPRVRDGGGNVIPANLTQSVAGVYPNVTPPVYESATGRIYFDSGLGGKVVCDPQAGTVTFTGIAPRPSDRVLISYRPQTMRLNVTREDSGRLTVAGAGAGLIPHVPSSGSNTGALAFLDRAINTRALLSSDAQVIKPGADPNAPATVSRYWLFYRKTQASSTGPATIFYKTMRLMVRLPNSILRDVVLDANNNPAGYTVGNHLRIAGNRGPVEVDWIRGRLYFTEVDEGNQVTVEFDYARDAGGNVQTAPATPYRVSWGDEISIAIRPGDQTTTERALPTDLVVNEGQITAFKDPFQDKVWVFWSSTRAGTNDLYYMTLSPQFYTVPSM